METATFWVIIVVVLSFGIIALLNYQRTGSTSSSRQPMKPCAEPISTAVPAKQTLTAGRTARLEMTIAKQLESFPLDVQLVADRGTLGLLGASGSGKSMSLRAIAGLVTPERGRILVNGRVLYDSASGVNLPSAARRVSVVFQDYALFPHMTVAQNVGFGLNKVERLERHKRVRRQLQLTRIDDLAGRYPGQLSGGQRQRVALARALATEPEALLLDEPFAALDPHLRRQQLREALAEYNGVVLFVTHDMEEAFRFCVDLAVIDHGRILSVGPKRDLFERPGTLATARLTGCKNIAAINRLSPRQVEVPGWDCQLSAATDIAETVAYLGIRAHHLSFTDDGKSLNTFACWPTATSEAPHEITVYLRLNTPPVGDQAAHLQVDMPKDAYRNLQSQPLPWHVYLSPERLLLLQP